MSNLYEELEALRKSKKSSYLRKQLIRNLMNSHNLEKKTVTEKEKFLDECVDVIFRLHSKIQSYEENFFFLSVDRNDTKKKMYDLIQENRDLKQELAFKSELNLKTKDELKIDLERLQNDYNKALKSLKKHEEEIAATKRKFSERVLAAERIDQSYEGTELHKYKLKAEKMERLLKAAESLLLKEKIKSAKMTESWFGSRNKLSSSEKKEQYEEEEEQYEEEEKEDTTQDRFENTIDAIVDRHKRMFTIKTSSPVKSVSSETSSIQDNVDDASEENQVSNVVATDANTSTSNTNDMASIEQQSLVAKNNSNSNSNLGKLNQLVTEKDPNYNDMETESTHSKPLAITTRSSTESKETVLEKPLATAGEVFVIDCTPLKSSVCSATQDKVDDASEENQISNVLATDAANVATSTSNTSDMESIEKQSLVAKNTSCANSSSIVTEAHGVNTEQISNLKQSVVVTVEYLNSEDFIKKFKKSSGPKNDDNKNSGPEVIITRLSGNQDVDMSGNDTAVKPKQAENTSKAKKRKIQPAKPTELRRSNRSRKAARLFSESYAVQDLKMYIYGSRGKNKINQLTNSISKDSSVEKSTKVSSKPEVDSPKSPSPDTE